VKIKTSISYKVVMTSIYVILVLFTLVTLLPVFSIFAGSLTSARENIMNPFILWPREPTLDAYRYIFSTDTMFNALRVTLIITIVGTAVNIFMTVLMAWPLAHTDLMGRKYLMFFVTFTLLFSGGMIPAFLVVRATGLLNTYSALIIPSAIGPFNLIIMKNFFQSIPSSLEESAKLDGANDLLILFRIIIPLAKAAIATITLFYAVSNWNTFTSALLYITDSRRWPLQVLLRQIVVLSQGGIGDELSLGEDFIIPPQGVKMAAIVFATVPILLVYPFLQKHFVKGVMVGSIKG